MREDQRLVVDYLGHPTEYDFQKEPRVRTEMVPLGEADIKLTRYCKEFPKLQAGDWDSVPIALPRLQNHGMSRISILRLRTQTEEDSPKRKRGEKQEYQYCDVSLLYHVLVSEILPTEMRS